MCAYTIHAPLPPALDYKPLLNTSHTSGQNFLKKPAWKQWNLFIKKSSKKFWNKGFPIFSKLPPTLVRFCPILLDPTPHKIGRLWWMIPIYKSPLHYFFRIATTAVPTLSIMFNKKEKWVNVWSFVRIIKVTLAWNIFWIRSLKIFMHLCFHIQASIHNII